MMTGSERDRPPTVEDFWTKYDKPVVDAFAQAEKEGWAEVSKPISTLMLCLERLNLTSVPLRAGEEPISVLTPKQAKDAAPCSLSAQYGTGVFPLHTDGAHLEYVPDFILLEATTTGDGVPTMLQKLSMHDAWTALGDALSHGMFLVENGHCSFYAPAYRDGFRYDPGCMKPADNRAEQVADYFGQLELAATAYQWEGPGKTLIVANRKALHGRGDATRTTHRELRRVMLRRSGK